MTQPYGAFYPTPNSSWTITNNIDMVTNKIINADNSESPRPGTTPTVTVSANPTSVSSGGSSTLTWSSTNATSCTASGGWSGKKATSASQILSNLTSTATFTLTCSGAGGTGSSSATITVTGGGDTTPPSTPTGLTATAISSSQINLSWTASTDNVGVTGYKIFRDGVQVGTSATDSFSSTGLAASTVYSYTVSANDAAGNNSAQSSATGAITSSAGAQSIAVGNRVVTTANLNVRQSASASATKLGTESIGALGTVVGGPTTAGGYTWWQINYDNGISGWSISTYLLAATANTSPAVGMAVPAQGNLTLIQQQLQQVQTLTLQLQSLQSQMAGAGASLGN